MASAEKKPISVDILIGGAGMAGILAGLAASREGLKVMIVERTYSPGGQATSTLVSEMSGYTHLGGEIYGGIEKELVDHLLSVNSARLSLNMPLIPSAHARADRLRYNPEALKVLIDWLTAASTIKAVGGCHIEQLEESSKGVRAIVRGGRDTLEVEARVAIDATGNAELAKMSGLETEYLPQHEASTLLFRLSGTEPRRVDAFMYGKKAQETVLRGHHEGALPGKHISIAPIPGTNDVVVNATRTFVDPESNIDITEGIIQSRTQMLRIIPFLKENIPGLKSAALAAIATVIGIRDGHRIVGETRITERDLLELRRYPDAVAFGCGPIGSHVTIDDDVDWAVVPGIYQIPYSAMIPRKSQRIIAAGKSISCDPMALTSIRCIPVVMNTGEVAGHAAAMAVRKGTTPAKLDPTDLIEHLKEKGVFFG